MRGGEGVRSILRVAFTAIVDVIVGRWGLRICSYCFGVVVWEIGIAVQGTARNIETMSYHMIWHRGGTGIIFVLGHAYRSSLSPPQMVPHLGV